MATKIYEKSLVEMMLDETNQNAPAARFWWMLKNFYTLNEAKAAMADKTLLKLEPKLKASSTSNAKKVDKPFGKARFWVFNDGIGGKRTLAKRVRNVFTDLTEEGWSEDMMAIVNTKIKVSDENGRLQEIPSDISEEITIGAKKYELYCFGQGGLKKGVACYVSSEYLDRKIKNSEITVRQWADMVMALDMPINKRNQIRALLMTSATRTKALAKNLIILPAIQREDEVDNVIHSDEKLSLADKGLAKVQQALADGYCVGMPNCGLSRGIHQLRPCTKAFCYVMTKEEAWSYIGVEVTDVFGRTVKVTSESIITTTDNIKDIKAYSRDTEGYHKWLDAQIDDHIWECELHFHNGIITLARQNAQMFHQISDEALDQILRQNLARWVMLRSREAYDSEIMRSFTALRQPELVNAIANPLLHESLEKKYLSAYRGICCGKWNVEGNLAYGIADPFWFMDVYIGRLNNDGSVTKFAVDNLNAGKVPANQIWYGSGKKNESNPFMNRKCCISRFPQVKPGMPVVTVTGDACYGAVMFSMRPGDMCLQDLDADLDGDKFYLIFEEGLVEAMEHSHERFGWGHLTFDKPAALPKMKTMSLAEFGKHNALLNLGDGTKAHPPKGVGVFSAKQFPIWEGFGLCDSAENMLIPAMDKSGKHFAPISVEEAEKHNAILAVLGNFGTDAGKGGFDIPDSDVGTMHNIRGFSDRYAHHRRPDSGKPRLIAMCNEWNAAHPDQQIDVEKFLWVRVWRMVSKYMAVQELRGHGNDFLYDDNGQPMEDRVKEGAIYSYGKVPYAVEKNVFWHRFGNKLDDIYATAGKNGNAVNAMILHAPTDSNMYIGKKEWNKFTNMICEKLPTFVEEDWADKGVSLTKYFIALNTAIIREEMNCGDDDRAWHVEDNIAEQLLAFAKMWALEHNVDNVSNEEAAWLCYNALAWDFMGIEHCANATAFGYEKFLRLFNDMLIAQVCENAGREVPKKRGSANDNASDFMSQVRESEELAEQTTVKVAAPAEPVVAETEKETPPVVDQEELNKLAASLGRKPLGSAKQEEPVTAEESAPSAEVIAAAMQFAAATGRKPLGAKKRRVWNTEEDDDPEMMD